MEIPQLPRVLDALAAVLKSDHGGYFNLGDVFVPKKGGPTVDSRQVNIIICQGYHLNMLCFYQRTFELMNYIFYFCIRILYCISFFCADLGDSCWHEVYSLVQRSARLTYQHWQLWTRNPLGASIV